MRRRGGSVVLPLCLAALSLPVFGETWFVNRNNVSGIEDGESWQTPFASIQSAIDAAEADGGGEIWVAAGIYDEPRVSHPYFSGAVNTGSVELKPGVHLYGGFLGIEGARDERDWAANETIIDGSESRDGSPAYHVVLGADDALLDGFIIIGGNADGAEVPDDPRGYGGGMLNLNVSPTVRHCLFRENTAIYGGGVCNGNASPVFWGCSFNNNGAHYGGGMSNFSSAPILRDCGFSGNEASLYGGGMANLDSSATLERCVFSANHARIWGGGMAATGDSTPTLTACSFEDNMADNWGGGMGNYGTSPALESCVFRNNSAQEWGGGIGNHRADPGLNNCEFTGNAAEKWGGGVANYQSTPILSACEFDGNTADYGGGMANHLSSPALTNCAFSNNQAALYGGGMLNFKSSPEVQQCVFTANQAEYGGGMANGDGSAPALDNCTFHDNKAVWGGGIANVKSSPPLRNNRFTGNEAEKWGGGMVNFQSSAPVVMDSAFLSNLAGEWGGAIANVSSSPQVSACAFTGNRAEGGGAMANSGSAPKVSGCVFQDNRAGGGAGMLNYRSSTAITDCTFDGNQADFDGGGMANIDATPKIRKCVFSANRAGYAAGMFNLDANADVSNCIFLSNEAEHYGGGMINDGRLYAMSNIVFAQNIAAVGGGLVNGDASPTLYHCTFAHNRALGSPETHVLGGGIANWDASPAIINSILWSNEGGQIESGGDGGATLRYCNVGGGHPGTGNMDVPPMFTDPDAGNYRLSAISPCLDVGTIETYMPLYDFDDIFRFQGRGPDLGPFEYVDPDEPFHTLRLERTGPGTTMPPPGTYTIQDGSVISLRAFPDAAARFSRWHGVAPGEDPTQEEQTLLMDQDRHVTAAFLDDRVLYYERTVHGLDDDGFLIPGTQTLDITINITQLRDLGPMTAFAMQEELPQGWSFAAMLRVTGSPMIYPQPGASDILEWAWIQPPTMPMVLEYRVNVPAGETGPACIRGQALFRVLGPELRSNEAETLIQLSPTSDESKILEENPGEGIEVSMTPDETPVAVVYAPGAAMSAVRTLFAREEIPEDPIHAKRCKRLPMGCGANDGTNGSSGLSENLLLMMGVLVVLLAADRRYVASPREKQ